MKPQTAPAKPITLPPPTPPQVIQQPPKEVVLQPLQLEEEDDPLKKFFDDGYLFDDGSDSDSDNMLSLPSVGPISYEQPQKPSSNSGSSTPTSAKRKYKKKAKSPRNTLPAVKKRRRSSITPK